MLCYIINLAITVHVRFILLIVTSSHRTLFGLANRVSSQKCDVVGRENLMVQRAS